MKRRLSILVLIFGLTNPCQAFLGGLEGLATQLAIPVISTALEAVASVVLLSTDIVTGVLPIVQFIEDNETQLASDLARGEGEYLDALADLLDVPAHDRAAWMHGLQQTWMSQSTSDADLFGTHFLHALERG